jgi:hypothetical protein
MQRHPKLQQQLRVPGTDLTPLLLLLLLPGFTAAVW